MNTQGSWQYTCRLVKFQWCAAAAEVANMSTTSSPSLCKNDATSRLYQLYPQSFFIHQGTTGERDLRVNVHPGLGPYLFGFQRSIWIQLFEVKFQVVLKPCMAGKNAPGEIPFLGFPRRTPAKCETDSFPCSLTGDLFTCSSLSGISCWCHQCLVSWLIFPV